MWEARRADICDMVPRDVTPKTVEQWERQKRPWALIASVETIRCSLLAVWIRTCLQAPAWLVESCRAHVASSSFTPAPLFLSLTHFIHFVKLLQRIKDWTRPVPDCSGWLKGKRSFSRHHQDKMTVNTTALSTHSEDSFTCMFKGDKHSGLAWITGELNNC